MQPFFISCLQCVVFGVLGLPLGLILPNTLLALGGSNPLPEFWVTMAVVGAACGMGSASLARAFISRRINNRWSKRHGTFAGALAMVIAHLITPSFSYMIWEVLSGRGFPLSKLFGLTLVLLPWGGIFLGTLGWILIPLGALAGRFLASLCERYTVEGL